MKKQKTIKAWAIVDKNNNLAFTLASYGKYDLTYVWKLKRGAEWSNYAEIDDKVVKVEIKILEK